MKDSRAGHRERLRERYLRSSIRGFSEREILELLLTYAIPRKDTREIALALQEKFKTLHHVFSQPPAMLQTVDGIGPAASVLINMIPYLMSMSTKIPADMEVMSSPDKVHEYLKNSMGTLRKERFIALLLDSQNRLLGEAALEFGTVDRASVHPRNLVEKIISTGATGVILVHNHPSGTPRPSREDIALTDKLTELGKSLGFRILDHLIVADNQVYSIRN